MPKRHQLSFLFVCLTSGILACLANLTYLIGSAHIPQNTVYLGATHYWEDFMFYISQFLQGANGALMNTNLFTEEVTKPTLLYFPNILLGHIGQIIPVMPSTIYNISCIVLSFFILIGAYVLFMRVFPNKKLGLIAWMFFAFSTSFMNKLPPGLSDAYWPFDLWGTPHFLFNRIGGMPHRLVLTLLFFGTIALLFDKKLSMPRWVQTTLACIVAFGMTLIQPLIGVLILGIYVLVVVPSHRETHPHTVVASVLGGILACFYFLILFLQDPYVQALGTEGKWQTVTTFLFLLRSIGPISIFALVGMLTIGKKASPIEHVGIVLLIGSYTLFLFPILQRVGISNTRLLFPGAYLFLAWFGALGLEKIATVLTKITIMKKTHTIALLCIVFLVAVAPTIAWELQQKITIAQNQTGYLYYLPKTAYDAFMYVKNAPEHTPIILGNPISHIDTLIPALSGQKTMTGPLYATVNREEKIQTAQQFYTLTLSPNDAHVWLRAHHVSYVLFTVYDGDMYTFQQTYQFLFPVFSTPSAMVFKVQ